MAKRSAAVAFDTEPKELLIKKEGKKHSLDSDEEDSGAEEEKKNVLDVDDIEGEEEGVAGVEGEITITPFNMKEELEEGHFDTQGHFHWKKEKEIRDGWLDNIDWVKIKGRPEDKYKVHKDDAKKGLGDESSSEDEEPEEKFNLIQNYKEIFQHMKPKETIAVALQRLGAGSKISSAERWKRKKAGIVDEGSQIVTRITELANQILTKLGNMDIYQETYEKIGSIIAKDKNKNEAADLDMYADDFDQKEKQTLDSNKTENSESKAVDETEETSEVKWEFKWSQNDNAEISGPHSTDQMQKCEMASSSFSSLSNTSGLEDVKNERTAETLPCILDGKFFIYSKTESTSTKKVAICTSCQPKEVKICGFNNSTSNFVTHLKRRHGENVYKEYQTHLKCVKKNKPSSRTSNCRQSEIIDNGNKSAEQTVPQEQFNENILKFFIHSMIPLQAIDDPFFNKIFESLNITTKELQVVSRKSLGRLIDNYYIKEITNIKSELHNIKEVCTTADIWLGKSRSFLGVTAHWLDSNLERKSKTLACRIFTVTHSYDRIAFLLEAVHSEFGLDSRKVLAAVTNSSSNFLKAFKEFGVDLDNLENFTDGNSESEEGPIIGEHFNSEGSSMSHFNTLNDIDPLAFIENVIPQTTILELPVHLRCSAHKLNLCATTDANKVLRNNETTIGDIHNQVIKKCNNLWNSAGRLISAEIIQGIIGNTLSRPVISRWNSLYDSLKEIASIQDKSVQLYVALGLTNVLRTNDFQYINEYLRCSKPIAEALNIIQDEQNMYYGILLPCLVSLRKKLQKFNRESLVFCKKLAEKYLESVERRFSEFFDVSSKIAQNAVIAAMSYPRFKDKWMACINIEYHSRIKSVFKGAVVKEIHEAPETFQDTPKNRYEDSYFEFDTDSSETDSTGDINQVQRSKADVIISHYLADQDKDISMLNRYPEIKNIFIKYNTPLPSSGPVERLFPYAIMTNSPKSHRLSDEMFEKRVLLKSNLHHK